MRIGLLSLINSLYLQLPEQQLNHGKSEMRTNRPKHEGSGLANCSILETPVDVPKLFVLSSHILVVSLYFFVDERYHIIWTSPQQVSHNLQAMWKGFVSHSKETVRIMRIPQSENAYF